MASLDLHIDPQIIASQAVFFLTGIALVKKLMLDPYLSLSERREALTLGDKSNANLLEKEVAEKQTEIETKIKEAVSGAHSTLQDSKKRALMEQGRIVADAKEKSLQALERLRSEISRNIDAERLEVDKIVGELTEKIYQEVVTTDH